MTAAELFAYLYTHGVALEDQGDQLRCKAPKGIISPALYKEIRRHKSALLTLLRTAQALHAQSSSNQAHHSTLLTASELQYEVEQEDLALPSLISSDPPREAHTVFLTGSTGFLGAFLLHELLQQTKANVYCLIRAHDIQSARVKLQDTFKLYALEQAVLEDRVIPIIGDLAQPGWGIDEQQFQELATTIDVIYHNGALVNLVYPYSQLKAANVLGTKQILRLATSQKVKPVHFISTISVFSPQADAVLIDEQTPIDDLHEHLPTGYSQSKWVAEKLVTNARDKGLPVVIYRPGMISGHSCTGVWNTKDYMCRIIKGCLQMERVPVITETETFAPVDYVSKSIIYLSRQQSSFGRAFHLINPHTLSGQDMVALVRSLGYRLQEIPYPTWRQALIEATQESSENALSPLLQFFLSDDIDSPHNPFEESVVHAHCQQTSVALARAGIFCPPIDATLFKTYFSYFQQVGFLPTSDS